MVTTLMLRRMHHDMTSAHDELPLGRDSRICVEQNFEAMMDQILLIQVPRAEVVSVIWKRTKRKQSLAWALYNVPSLCVFNG